MNQSVYFSAGVMVLVTTVAQFNGHVTGVAFYQIVGSIVGTAILSSVIANFK